jgi:hypothetical protein
MRWLMVLTIGVLACGGGAQPSARPGSAAVYERIAALTDCAALQREFDTAEANGARDRAAGKAEQAEWSVAYMKAADERMRALRCHP